MTVVDLQRFWKAFAERRSNFRSFGRVNQIALWKIAYFSIAILLFAFAAWNRFSLPQDPLAVFGAWAGSQLWILKGERSGLLTRTATESVSSCAPTKS